MLELWLIRHAESLGNLDGTDADTALSPRGRLQAEALATALAGERFDSVVCSPMLRARETAAIALPDHAALVEPRLREFRQTREQFVDLSHLDTAGLLALLQPHGEEEETGRQFMARVRLWLSELPARGRVAAVSHFGVVRACLIALIPADARPQVLRPAGITVVRIAGEGNHLVRCDDCRHLAAVG